MKEIAQTGIEHADLDDVAGTAARLLRGALEREDGLSDLEEPAGNVLSLLGPVSRVAGGWCGSRECKAALRLAVEVEAGGAEAEMARDALRCCDRVFDVVLRCMDDLKSESAADEPNGRKVSGSALAMFVAATLLAYLGLVAEDRGLAHIALGAALAKASALVRCCDKLMFEHPEDGWGTLSAELICPGMSGE